MIYFVTLALDALPFLPIQLATFNRLKIPFKWIIVEGCADNVNDTSWVAKPSPRLSNDGSHEWLTKLAKTHPRVIHLHQSLWPGKTAMINAALKHCTEPGLLWQIDADELWTATQIEAMEMAFRLNAQYDAAQFKCRYFLGPNIVITGTGHYGNRGSEWMRIWRFTPGLKALTHEPPIFSVPTKLIFDRDTTERMNCVFDHWAYFYRRSVEFKEAYYRYPNAVAQWESLQRNTEWPCKVSRFLKWVQDDSVCDLLFKV